MRITPRRASVNRAAFFVSTRWRPGSLMDGGQGEVRMAREQFDITSKWLLHRQGKGVLLLGGLKGVQRIEPMPGEIAQRRRYPDGLLLVSRAGERKPRPVLVE